MDEVIALVIRCIGIILIAVVTYVVVPAIKDWRKEKLTASQRETLEFWVSLGVLWAKQWMQSATGAEKKAQVMTWVRAKRDELRLPFTDDDIDKAIEAIYNTVKDVTDAAAGTSELSDVTLK